MWCARTHTHTPTLAQALYCTQMTARFLLTFPFPPGSCVRAHTFNAKRKEEEEGGGEAEEKEEKGVEAEGEGEDDDEEESSCCWCRRQNKGVFCVTGISH